MQTIRGLPPVVQIRDAYYGSRRFSVVWCETSRYSLKVYYTTLVVHIFSFSIKRWTLDLPLEEIGCTLIKFLR